MTLEKLLTPTTYFFPYTSGPETVVDKHRHLIHQYCIPVEGLAATTSSSMQTATSTGTAPTTTSQRAEAPSGDFDEVDERQYAEAENHIHQRPVKLKCDYDEKIRQCAITSDGTVLSTQVVCGPPSLTHEPHTGFQFQG